MNSLHIVGAGMAGLLAANMLKHRSPEVFERNAEIPNNHSAVLRFRSDIVGRTLGIEFKRVTMIKDNVRWHSPVADALAYSYKNTAVMRSDRSLLDGLTSGERWIAPPDLIGRMARYVPLRLMHEYQFTGDCSAIISTMPMPALMKALDYPDREHVSFGYSHGTNVRCSIRHCDAYVSLYVPDPAYRFSRVSITGRELVLECPNQMAANINAENAWDLVCEAAEMLGVNPNLLDRNATVHEQKYAKILPINNALREDFIHWATDKHHVFSLGRFATWRPGLLLDDLVQDVQLIERWLNSKYKAARHR